jgi:hypothetical protein
MMLSTYKAHIGVARGIALRGRRRPASHLDEIVGVTTLPSGPVTGEGSERGLALRPLALLTDPP